MRLLLPLLGSLLLAGCGSSADRPVRLGARGLFGYHLRAGASSAVPDGEIGYVVTANGQGGFRLAWVAFSGSGSSFTGTITSDGSIDPASVAGFSGREQITVAADGSRVDFASVAGAAPDGVDLVPSVDPIYVDARIDGAPANIFFTGADTSRLYRSAYNPVAFTSP